MSSGTRLPLPGDCGTVTNAQIHCIKSILIHETTLMPVYEYKALDARGKRTAGLIEADSPRHARMKLRSEGYYPVEIRSGAAEVQRTGALRPLPLWRIWTRIRPQERAAFTRQLATLLGAGIPLVGALDAIIEQTRGRWFRRALVDIREEVLGGQPLAEALSRHGNLFSDLYVNMVHAGESSGALEAVLHRLADLLERNVRLRNRIQASLFYPLTMLVIGVGVLTFLITYVVPIVTRLFEEAKQDLPLPTVLLIGSSQLLIHWWWLILLGLVSGAVLLQRVLSTPAGRLFWDRLKLRLPLIGPVYGKLITARFSRTLGTLLQGGVPLTTALSIVQHVIDNAFLGQHVERAIQEVNEGEDLTVPLAKSGAFPPLVIQMIAAGERSGELEGMLLRVAETYEDEVDNALAALTSLLEPLLILAMGCVVGFIVISILLPILEMSRLLG